MNKSRRFEVAAPSVSCDGGLCSTVAVGDSLGGSSSSSGNRSSTGFRLDDYEADQEG